MEEEWITTLAAGELSGYHPDSIRRLVLTGKLKARKFGRDWQVSRKSLMDHMRKAEQLGDKRGPKPRGK